MLYGGLLGGGGGFFGAPAVGAEGYSAMGGASALAPTGGAAVSGGLPPVATGGISNNAALSSIANAGGALPSSAADPISNLYDTGALSGGAGSSLPDVSSGGIPSWAKWGAGALGLGYLMNKDNSKYGTFTQNQITQNPLPYPSNFNTYKALDTSVMKPMGQPAGYTGTSYGAPGYTGSQIGYAAGGIASAAPTPAPITPPAGGPVEQMSRDNALGQNQMFPQAAIHTDAYASPTNRPFSQDMIASASDTNVDPYTGAEKFATGGGVGHLGGYSDGGRMLKGPGDGMSDNIPATIGGKQPARLADGEFVVPADVVSHLGNGSTDAGAKHLYNMMDKVRAARTGTKKQGKQIKAAKFLPK